MFIQVLFRDFVLFISSFLFFDLLFILFLVILLLLINFIFEKLLGELCLINDFICFNISLSLLLYALSKKMKLFVLELLKLVFFINYYSLDEK